MRHAPAACPPRLPAGSAASSWLSASAGVASGAISPLFSRRFLLCPCAPPLTALCCGPALLPVAATPNQLLAQLLAASLNQLWTIRCGAQLAPACTCAAWRHGVPACRVPLTPPRASPTAPSSLLFPPCSNGFLLPYPSIPRGWKWLNRISPTTWILYGLGTRGRCGAAGAGCGCPRLGGTRVQTARGAALHPPHCRREPAGRQPGPHPGVWQRAHDDCPVHDLVSCWGLPGRAAAAGSLWCPPQLPLNAASLAGSTRENPCCSYFDYDFSFIWYCVLIVFACEWPASALGVRLPLVQRPVAARLPPTAPPPSPLAPLPRSRPVLPAGLRRPAALCVLPEALTRWVRPSCQQLDRHAPAPPACALRPGASPGLSVQPVKHAMSSARGAELCSPRLGVDERPGWHCPSPPVLPAPAPRAARRLQLCTQSARRQQLPPRRLAELQRTIKQLEHESDRGVERTGIRRDRGRDGVGFAGWKSRARWGVGWVMRCVRVQRWSSCCTGHAAAGAAMAHAALASNGGRGGVGGLLHACLQQRGERHGTCQLTRPLVEAAAAKFKSPLACWCAGLPLPPGLPALPQKQHKRTVLSLLKS